MGIARLDVRLDRHPNIVIDRHAAVDVVRWWLSALEPIAPRPRWWREGHPGPVDIDRIDELMTDLEMPQPWPFHAWDLLAGDTAQNLYAKVRVGLVDPTCVAEARLRFDNPDEAARLERVFEELRNDARIAVMRYAIGSDFYLRQLREPPTAGPQPPGLGWRTCVRTASPGSSEVEVPDGATLSEGDGYIEIVLGPSPFIASPALAVEVRAALIEAGYLPAQGW